MKKIKLFFFENTLTVFLVVFFVTEAISKIFKYESSQFFITPIFKASVLVFATIQLLRFPQKVKPVLILTLFFAAGQLFLLDGFDSLVLINAAKYLFLVILILYVNNYRPSKLALKKLFLVFEYIILINSVLIVLGLLFSVFYFKTYQGARAGYNGLYITSATSTYVYMIALFYFYLKYKNRFLFKLKPIIVIISSLIIGTKGVIIALIGVLIVYVFQQKNKAHKGLALLIIIFSGGIGFYFILIKTNLWTKIYYKYDMLTLFLSYRNQLLLEKMMPFIQENWNIGNYLFGGINSVSTRSQMGFFDLFYFFGILGTLYYIYVLARNYFTFKLNKINKLFLSVIIFLIFLSGNFFLNASVAIYVIILREAMTYYKDKTI